MAENNCVVCFKNFRIYSVGECDHPVCYECSARMRVLCCQNECPMCRHEMEKVVFTEKVRPFRRLNKTYALYDKRYRIAFENDYIRDVFEALLEYVCLKCHRAPIFDTFESLKAHMKHVHDLYCCDLCADNLKIFPGEMRYYTRQELIRHQKIGDVDNRSHRGHPLCEFCRVRYLDRDELYKHLRKEHFFCHICDGEGVQQFYGTYILLRDHYREKHYLCEEGACIEESMTSVFPTEIDLKAHKALVHFKNSRNKQAIRQARTLDLEFALPPRHSDRRARYGQDGFVEDFSADANSSQETDVNIMVSLEENFPTLGNSSSYRAPRSAFVRESNNRLTFNDRNFPALGSEANINPNMANSADVRPSSSGSITSTNKAAQIDHKKPKEKKKTAQRSRFEPTTSALALTWVEKAKEKPPSAERMIAAAASSSDSTTKPPSMNRRNFPTLLGNASAQETVWDTVGCSKTSSLSKKNKKSTSVGFEIDESKLPTARVNYSEATGKNTVVKEGKKKNSSDASADASRTKKKEERSLNLNKDNKTHSFLLNANRKKVKMKPELLIPLNDPSRSHELLPLQTAKSKSKETQETGAVGTASDSNVNNNAVEKNKDKPKDNKSKEPKRGKPSTRKVGGSESSASIAKTKPPQGTGLTNDSKMTDVKQKNQNSPKKTEKAAAEQSPKKSTTTSKPPPGFEKPTSNSPPLPLPPPGFDPLTSSRALTADATPFVYQQPDEFDQRNSQLIEKIGSSLVQQSEEGLNGFKNMSLLFREGYISAADYYLYCLENIEPDRFNEVFVDLIALLPNIFKQQELWAIHQSTTPSRVENSSSLVDYCTICFQILKLDDAIMHYSKHGVTSETLLQYSSLAKY